MARFCNINRVHSLTGALALFFYAPIFSNAGTITFFDLTDSVSVSDDTGRLLNFTGCGGEGCIVTLLSPPSPVGALTALPSRPDTFIGERTGNISDYFSVAPGLTFGSITFSFGSDSEVPFDIGRSANLIEDGTVQTAFTIGWVFSDVVDTVKFQSDVDVPEPSTTMLMLTGLAVLAISIRRS